MAMSDLLADTLTRLRNGQMAKHSYVITKSSKLIKAVLEVLKREGYIIGFEEFEERKGINLLKVDLKYFEGTPVMNKIRKISKPGRRIYKSISDLPKSQGGLGIYVVSTSQGVLSDYEARQKHIGGEVLCMVS